MSAFPGSDLCRHGADVIHYRDKNLVEDLIGKESFLAVAYRQILNAELTPAALKLLNSVLIALMEHGLTPSAISTRLTYTGAPESMQGAIAAGLLGVGDNFVGSMENCGALLHAIVTGPTGTAESIVHDHRSKKRHLPGFGHHLHSPDDPRAVALLDLARLQSVAGSYVAALEELASALDAQAGTHITINATGAAAAILGDIGVPPVAMRGFALIARTAGLVAHFVEEHDRPLGRAIWDKIDKLSVEAAQEAASARSSSVL